jgi:hypothetical protein
MSPSLTQNARPILDPATLNRDTARAPDGPAVLELPKKTRMFGFVPDHKVLLPGDAVLVKSQRAGLIGRQIVRFQLESYECDHACWTHVAVYIGEGTLVEAMPWHGVRTSSIYSLVPSRSVLVRRDPKLNMEERYKIAVQAASRLGQKYSHWRLPSLIIGAAVGFWSTQRSVRMTRALVCSTLYSDAWASVTEAMLIPGRLAELWPCHISATLKLDDVLVPWVRVKSGGPNAPAGP